MRLQDYQVGSSTFGTSSGHKPPRSDRPVVASPRSTLVSYTWIRPSDIRASDAVLLSDECIFVLEVKSDLLFRTAAGLVHTAVVDTIPVPTLRVTSPFHVQVRTEPEEVSVYHADSGVFGVGDTEAEALEDFRRSIAELYLNLEENRDRLGPVMQEVARVLASKIGPS